MTPPNITLRDATPDDAAALIDYLIALRAEALDTISSTPPPTVDAERAWIEASAQAEHDAILVLDAGDRLVGILDIRSGKRAHNRHCGVFGMSIDKDWRGRGLGERLVRAALERCAGWPDFHRLELNVVPWNRPAIALYEKLGFEQESVIRKGVNLRGAPEDLLVMRYLWDRDSG